MGASCAGSTTLGNALAEQLSYTYFDTDTYFWEPADIPFSVKRDPVLRNKMLENDIENHNNNIVGGSIINWGDEWRTKFDLIVFLYIPKEIRIARLIDRELERYGDKIYTDAALNKIHHDFITWASGYDDNITNGRNFAAHETWLNKLSCPVLKITGDTTVNQRVEIVTETINKLLTK